MTSTNIPSAIPAAETILTDLVHDLRQDLGNIETVVYCLRLLGDSAPARAGGYLRTIEQQVSHAESRLSLAGAELARLRAQRADAAGNLDLT